jgi:hypothetical protein
MRSIPVLFLIVSTPVWAQVDPSVLKRVRDVSARYNECVYSSGISRIRASNYDVNLAVEGALDSCATENAQMVMVMRQNGFSSAQIEDTLLDKKTGIKRELRKMIMEIQGSK